MVLKNVELNFVTDLVNMVYPVTLLHEEKYKTGSVLCNYKQVGWFVITFISIFRFQGLIRVRVNRVCSEFNLTNCIQQFFV